MITEPTHHDGAGSPRVHDAGRPERISVRGRELRRAAEGVLRLGEPGRSVSPFYP